MVALASPLSGSRVEAGGSGSLTSLCASCAPGGAWSSLKAHVRSFSLASPFAVLAADNNNTTSGDRPAQVAATASAGSTSAGARPSTHVIAIVVGVVGGIIAVAVVLALVYVLRVRRKVERFRRSMNVLGPELTPIPRPPDVASIDVHLANGSSLASVPTPDHQRHTHLSGTPSLTSPIVPLRGPPRKLTIDVGLSRAIQHTSRPSAGPQTPARSPYEVVVVPSPGPTSSLRREPHSATAQRATFGGSRLTNSSDPFSRSFVTSRPPPRKLTIDVGASRAIQHTSRPSASPQTPMRSPYEVVMVPSPGPASFPRREPHSAATLRATFEDSRLTNNEPFS
ncbi:hypothetical protein BJY52DRAFT_414030 [Lactarius psammicola]|nr:hypothetical protein BJY52DRAFT_414030 [Lactarius psammicola]